MLVNLRALLVRLIDIVLLRGGPEQLPASPLILGLAVMAYAVSSALTCLLVPKAPANWPAELLVGIVFTLTWYGAAFAIARKPERFLQTATAIFGVLALFTPILLPISIELQPYMRNPDPAAPAPAGLTLLGFLFGLWAIVVYVRVLRAAFEWHIVSVILFLAGMFFASAVVYGMLFGIPVEPV